MITSITALRKEILAIYYMSKVKRDVLHNTADEKEIEELSELFQELYNKFNVIDKTDQLQVQKALNDLLT